jgi:hypothetical protein
MKPLLQLCCLASLIYLQGCGDSMIKNSTNEAAVAAPAATAKKSIPVPVATTNKVIKDDKDLTGYWVGAFRADSIMPPPVTLESESEWANENKINISIDAINGNQVKGHSIDAGNFRPFTGTVERAGNAYHFVVKEPGDDQYDGVFNFTINTGDSVLTGSWKADQKIKTPARYYNLNKRFFAYDPHIKLEAYRYADTNKQKKVTYKNEDGAKYTDVEYAMTTGEFARYNASSLLLTDAQVANLKAADLLILRNSIYARHGYSFKKPTLRLFFDQQSWYIPVTTDVTGLLTPLEKQNITLLMRFEKNAKQYYDTFGR